jgi:hypothetical protein
MPGAEAKILLKLGHLFLVLENRTPRHQVIFLDGLRLNQVAGKSTSNMSFLGFNSAALCCS